MPKDNIVFFVGTSAHYVEMIRAARLVNETGVGRPILLFGESYPHMARDIDNAKRHKITSQFVYDLNNESQNSLSMEDTLHNKHDFQKISKHLIGKIFKILKFLVKLLKLKFLDDLYVIKKQKKLFYCILDKLKPVVLVVPESSIAYGIQNLLSVSRSLKIYSVALPYTIANHIETAESYFENSVYEMNGVRKWALKFFLPKWILAYKGKFMIPVPLSKLVAIELAGISPDQPWNSLGGGVDHICVESEAMQRLYISAGTKKEGLEITGSFSDDDIWNAFIHKESYRDELRSQYNFSGNNKILLCALPPNQFIAGRKPLDYTDYRQLIFYWIATLKKISGFDVVFKPHPRIDISDLEYISSLGVAISNWDTAKLVAISDMYVASVSSTIRWAILAGIPVINYDVYQYGYEDFKGVRGVFTVMDPISFEFKLEELTTRNDVFMDAKNSQQNDSKDWGIFDGQSSQRILSLLIRR